MKKNVLVTATIMLVAAGASAQISINPEIGTNFTDLAVKDDVGYPIDYFSKTGIKLGAYVGIPITRNFSFQPGAFYSRKGGTMYQAYTMNYGRYESKLKINLNYLEIPLNFSFESSVGKNGGIFVAAGPYIAYAISGSAKLHERIGVEKYNDKVDLSFGSKANADLKPFDFGFNVSVGYRWPFGIYARGQYGMGFYNANVYDGSIKNRGFALTFGYSFKFKND